MELSELMEEARAAMAPASFDYYVGGAHDELTLADNEAAWRRLRLRPSFLRDVTEVDTSIDVLGGRLASPIAIAPTAYQRLAHDEGELGTARAAESTGSLMVSSTLATTRLEEVAAAAPDCPRWFQLYVQRDREVTIEMVRRAEAAGFGALALTVDTPTLGHRPRDERNAFTLPDGLEMANLASVVPSVAGSGLAHYAATMFEAGLTPDHIAWLCGLTNLPVVVKGVLRGDDAIRSVDAGARGVWVSNHGGRQLDTAVATADALRDVVGAVAGRAEVYVDGGVRRASDVLKAIAMGARAVFLGRPVLWALASGGGDRVRALLVDLHNQLELAMRLSGVASWDAVPNDLVVASPTETAP